MKKLFGQLSRVGLNAFFFCILLMVLLAWLFPELGSEHSALPLTQITKYGVSIIFFFYGLKLSLEKLRTGLRNWKLHIVIQLTTFILFPCIGLTLIHFFGNGTTMLWLGFFYLTVLPSTVSSSVVMVSIAGGNMPAAIFNASISSIIGIFITPLWMSFYAHASAGADLTDVIIKLSLQVLLPVIVGLLLNKRLGAWADRFKKSLSHFDQAIILLIVFTAFSESFLGNMFDGFTIKEILLLAVALLLFFFVMAGLMYFISVGLNFSLADRITVIFCGSKKSLVQGAVMGRVLFPDPVTLGVVLLPLMLYHALQLMAGSALAQAIATNTKQGDV
jgi:sodium/bile acid cotransporter 7